MVSSRNLGLRALIAFVLVALAGPIAHAAAPVAAQSMCQASGKGPGDPHPGPAVPFIGGVITTDAGDPIAGASVLLFRCDAGDPQPAGETVTQADGRFVFGQLSNTARYVVFAPLTGALEGLVPTAETFNPSWEISGALGDAEVDMAFE